MKTTFIIIYYTNTSPLGEDVFTTNVFNKTELETQFKNLCDKLQNGESAEYMKEDNKRFYPSMLYVEKENDILYSYTYTGKKRISKYNTAA